MKPVSSTRLLPVLLLMAVTLCTAQKIPEQTQQPRRGIRAQLAPDSTSRRVSGPARPPTPRQTAPRYNGIAYQDTVAMLIVLVRFQDDNWGDCGQWWCHLKQWPHIDLFGSGEAIPRSFLPDWAPTLLERDPERVNAEYLSLQDSSLSAYYYWQSIAGPSGPHVLYGDVWPEVYVTERSNRDYYNRRDSMGTTVRRPSGFGYLTEELLDNLVDSGLDLGRYDHNRDGVVDHIMMLIRRDSLYSGQGWAILSGYYNAGGVPDRDNDHRPDSLRYWSPERGDSVRVDWAHSGSQNFTHNAGRGLLVHEYGHRLMDMPGHYPMIRFEGNVPGAKPLCGYARMCGGPATNDGSATTLSVHDRRRMGWIVSQVLDSSSGDREGVLLHDLYTSGEAVLIPLGPGAAGDTLTLANRHRISFFDRERSVPSLHPDYDYVYRGLATAGLHVSVSLGDPRGRYSRYRYGLLPADGAYDRLSRCSGSHPSCPGPHTYDGDLFGPQWKAQLTPWTRPNSSGYRRSDLIEEGAQPQWFAIDRIRYVPNDPDSTMLFDFVADARQRPQFLAKGNPWPVFREDSWMGPESGGLVFRDEVLVERGATLYIGADDVLSDSLAGRHASLGALRITFENGLRMEDGARLIVGPEAEIVVGRGVLGGAGAEFVVEPGATVVLGRGVRFEGRRLLGEPERALVERFQRR